VLGQTLKKAKVAGELREGRPEKTLTISKRFSLKDAGISDRESSHAQIALPWILGPKECRPVRIVHEYCWQSTIVDDLPQ
jgi:hypothetical protein